jgi:hypothetical protein
LKELPNTPLHIGGIENHMSDLQERGGFRNSVRKPENQPGGQTAATWHLGIPLERQVSQESKVILPAYLDGILRETHARKLRPDKEVLAEKGWDNFAEYAFDIAGFLSKPENPSIPKENIRARDEDALVKAHMDANAWEEEVVTTLEEDGFGHLAEGFKQDMQEYRTSVKATVQLWRENGLL